jgi:hypothetical protein
MRTPRKNLSVIVGGGGDGKRSERGRTLRNIALAIVLWILVVGWWSLSPGHESFSGHGLHLQREPGRDIDTALHHDKMQLQDDDRDIANNDVKPHINRVVGEGGNKGAAHGAYADYDHAVIVVGHAVVKVDEVYHADNTDNAWYLLPYQRNQGFPAIITSHIKKGAEMVVNDPSALLMFSGGQTRRDVGPMSEAASYYFVAKHQKWLPNKNEDGDHPRTFVEEFARDSFENLLFSLCRFREITSRYPAKVTVVGFDFKGHRFADMHRKALGFPEDKFHYIGLNPKDAHPGFEYDRAVEGEEKVEQVFAKDPYSCSSSLEGKRHLRNPFKRTVPYDQACPEIELLLHWCGPDLITERHTLPWTEGPP